MNNTGKKILTISAGGVEVVIPENAYFDFALGCISGCVLTAAQGETSDPRSRRELQKANKEQMNKFVKDKYRKKER